MVDLDRMPVAELFGWLAHFDMDARERPSNEKG